MPIDSPNLDDRTFHDLLVEAKAHVTRTCPTWTDLSAHEPGTVLLEAFAHMTEVMLYRINRLPEKAYVELLRLIGVQMHPPSAAVVGLEVRLSRPATAEIEIPKGLRVTAREGDAPTFTVGRRALVRPGEQIAKTLAYHAQWLEGEVCGVSTGQPGQLLRVRNRPLVARTSPDLDVLVGVEMLRDEDTGRVPSMIVEGTAYRIWREVESFAEQEADAHVVRVDRMDGTIQFPPAVRVQPRGGTDGPDGALSPLARPLGAVPPSGRRVIVSYWFGGGSAGNVRAQVLDVLKDPVAGGGVSVVNPQAARGGRDQESLENAMARGPLELFTLDRAVTAQDYESLARRNGGVARARAFTSRELRAHAAPGSVDVVLVPRLEEPVLASLEVLHEAQTAEILKQVQDVLDERRPAGSSCVVTWARYKRVLVRGDVVARRAERIADLRQRIAKRLRRAINPLPAPPEGHGWRFGQALKASHVYEAILAEPGVVYAENVRFVVDHVPDENVVALGRDDVEPRTWYAASGDRLFRSQNDAESWELVFRADAGAVTAVAVHPSPEHAGLAALAVNEKGTTARARLLLSRDGGETWVPQATFERLAVNDLAWTVVDRAPVLLVATDRGLYRIFVDGDAGPDLVVVDQERHDRGTQSIAVVETARRERFVAVVPTGVGGIFLSDSELRRFRAVGPGDEDVRVVRVQYDGLRTFLWVGVSAIGDTPGHGCYVLELSERPEPRDWVRCDRMWTGGSCHDLAFDGSIVHAASHRAGVLTLDSRLGSSAAWRATDVNAGLPLEATAGRVFLPVRAIAARQATTKNGGVLLAGGPRGVHRSFDEAHTFENRSERVFTESVTLPETWLFCSGEHELDVRPEGS